MRSTNASYSVSCLYRGSDEIRYRVAFPGTSKPHEITLSNSRSGNFARIHEFCEEHHLDVVQFVERLEAAAEDAGIWVTGGAA